MKTVSIPILLLVLILGLAGQSQAGAACADILPSHLDTFAILNVSGGPDSIVNVPIEFDIRRNVQAFQVFLDLDTTLLHPLVLGIDTGWDSTGTVIIGITRFYQWNVTGFLDTTETYPIVAEEEEYPSEFSTHLRLKVLGMPINYVDPSPGADSGTSIILTLPMHIDPAAQHGDAININFYEEDIIDPESFPPVSIGCQNNAYSNFEGLQTVVQLDWGRVIVDTLATSPPVIDYFTATPTSIMQGSNSTLAWSVSDATEITIDNGIGTVSGPTGTRLVDPSVTTTYIISASNASGSAIPKVATVTVTSPGDNNAPVVASVSPGSYVITEGENVAFTVSASDADGDALTLRALSLPTNASFGVGGEVSGVGSTQGSFSFTPARGQAGTYAIQFQAQDAIGSTSNIVTVSITVDEIEFDILFTTSTPEGSPAGGLAGKKSILLPIDLVTAQTVYGVQFDFLYDADYFDLDSVITTFRTDGFVVYDDIGGTSGEVRVVTFGMDNDSIVPGQNDSTAILYMVMSIDSLAPPGNYSVYIENGWESINPDPNYPSMAMVTDSGIIQVDRPGDVNLDQHVDVADAVNIVAQILGNYSLTGRQFDVADVVTNGIVDVFDLVGVVNLIFGIPVSPAPAQFTGSDMATVAIQFEDPLDGTADVLVVKSELPEAIAGVEIDIAYNPRTILLGSPETTEDADGLIMSYKDNGVGKMKILMHFTNPFKDEAMIQEGSADLIRIPVLARAKDVEGEESQVNLRNVLLSTSTASAVRVQGFEPALPSSFNLRQNYPNPFNPTTTIEFSIDGDGSGMQHVSLEIFNILGQHVKLLIDEKLPVGNHQVVWDASNDRGRQVATGIYLYKLQVENDRQTKKMLFLK
ncbi:MAG: T9SS type A sorting domain-containing protein [candidate division Zixibacteria bacterium]|nr:T9SS type A sorting domain-containing protein [candidate division Zixibacteria bacterium]